MKKETKECVICGRNEKQNKLTADDKRNNFHQSDIELRRCSECGECVCGFCNHLGVCH